MKYMLLVYGDENALSEAERESCYAESLHLVAALEQQGVFRGASPLQPTTTATSVRIRENRTLLTDGPFAETREQLGGFFLIEVENLDAALEIARRIPAARWGTVEVRPVIELPGLPQSALAG